MYALKPAIFPSFILFLMGALDCITTVIGVMYYGAAELNPLMTGIVNSSIPAFILIKISATVLIASTYFIAKRTLDTAVNKETRFFRYSSFGMKAAYAGLAIFLAVTVANNLIILLS